ncbi:MAG: ribosomal protein L23 [Cenarchaeum symbiont of Oopsacas minuta]|nr:ribosomal protein L23 [Cenarchaeum symbiont of Oopsacas minuta]
MNIEEATEIVQMPYNTEKTFAMVESEGKICFLVNRSASKPVIIDAIEVLYGTRPVNVNTARTIYGKKAFVKFASTEKARDLATKIGML